MRIPAFLERFLRRRFRAQHHVHLPKPTVTSPIQKALITSLNTEDQHRLERLTAELQNTLRI